jgi:hypothetical protein
VRHVGAAILATIDYWVYLFPNNTQIIFNYGVAYQTTNLVGLVAVTAFGSKWSFRTRILPGFLVFVALLAMMPFVAVSSLSILICGTIGLVDAVVAGSLFGLATVFPPRYMYAEGVTGEVASSDYCLIRVVSAGIYW